MAIEKVATVKRKTIEVGTGIKLVEPRKRSQPGDVHYLDPKDYAHLDRHGKFNEMQDTVAIAWAMQDAAGRDPSIKRTVEIPLLLGGTELGKTTAVEDLAATMGYKYYDMTLSAGMDEGNIVGGPVVNNNQGISDPRKFVLALSEIVQAMNNKNPDEIAVVNINEYNAVPTGNLIILHKIIDAYTSGRKFIEFPELGINPDGTPLKFPLNLDKIRFCISANPPDPGFQDRYQIDAASMRRYHLHKLPYELPYDDVRSGIYKMFTPIIDDLDRYPGFDKFVKGFAEFHIKIRAMYMREQLDQETSQKSVFANRSDPARVLKFLTTPDLFSATIPPNIVQLKSKTRLALKQFYINKLDDLVGTQLENWRIANPGKPTDREFMSGEIEKLIALIG